MERYHNFELILYYKPTIFNSIIKDDKNILHFAYMFHDKDIDKDGMLKEPHYHLLINYKNAKTFNACLTQFAIPGYNTFVIPVKDNQKQERFEYLYHINDPDKFQYAKELIVTDSANFWVNVQNGNTEKTVNLINDIINKRPLRELLETYGRDFVINYNKYISFANELRVSEDPKYIAWLERKKQDDCLEILADRRTGEIVGVEDKSIQIDFLLNDNKND